MTRNYTIRNSKYQGNRVNKNNTLYLFASNCLLCTIDGSIIILTQGASRVIKYKTLIFNYVYCYRAINSTDFFNNTLKVSEHKLTFSNLVEVTLL